MKGKLLLLSLWFTCQIVTAQSVKTVNITFDQQDFAISNNEMGDIVFDSSKHILTYNEDDKEPGLPLIPYNVVIPEGSTLSSMSIESLTTLLRNNVTIAANPIPVATNSISYAPVLSAPQYLSKVYPDSCVSYVGTTTFDGYTMAQFLVSPFVYDATNKELHLKKEITLSLSLKTSPITIPTIRNRGHNMHNIVKQLALNPEDVKMPSNNKITTEGKSIENKEEIEYVIITKSTLTNAFRNLVQWKKTKGINIKIISIEQIKNNYEGRSIQHKIKNCIYDLYCNHGLKYVLLGGDNTIIPTNYCWYKLRGNEETIPCDLFYSCFEGNYLWDENNNEIYGELDDNIDFSPSVFITRLPVRTSSNITSFTAKLMDYEKGNLSSTNNSILMTGYQLSQRLSDGRSDVEAKGDKLYNEFIQPYWTGNRKKLYDTYTNIEELSDQILNPTNLQQQLRKGYAFYSMMTHGSALRWKLGNEYYTNIEANKQINNGFTIITTNACSTNAFDDTQDPCLSEAFIRSKSNGVIAYLGCSREGWEYRGGSIGPSTQYEAQFYKKLFTCDPSCNHFGEIVAMAKMAYINLCKYPDSHRWIQLGLNPIGDPEMPIYTMQPTNINNVSITYDNENLKVTTSIPGCTICVMSENDQGKSYYKVLKDTNWGQFDNVKQDVSVCITKANYRPYIYKFIYGGTYIQNTTINESKNYDSKVIMIGSDVDQLKPFGPVFIKNGKMSLKAEKIILKPTITVSKESTVTLSNQ